MIGHDTRLAPGFSKLLVGTANLGKLREIEPILLPLPLQIVNLEKLGVDPNLAETGRTYSENAALKAKTFAKRTRYWTIADDSGLEVEALGGRPGIFSARYGDERAPDADRIALLITELSEVCKAPWEARFVCSVALSDKTGQIVAVATGECPGQIVSVAKGVRGFGYDPVFVPSGFTSTFSELSTSVKQMISHRARALNAIRPVIITCCRRAVDQFQGCP